MNPPGLIYRVIRNICSYVATFGLIPRSSNYRPQGISAMIRVKNSIDWIEACIRSLDKLADEIVVVDNGSTDGSYELIQRLENEIDKLRLFSFPDATLVDLSNYALSVTRYQWVIKWDADFIAHTSGASDIGNLRKFILSLDLHYYYCIYLRPVHLFGDFDHVFKLRGFVWTDALHTYSPKVKYILKEGIERLKVPKYFRIIKY
jgi:glycosyltransferase involved in cell wall biosynthesis